MKISSSDTSATITSPNSDAFLIVKHGHGVPSLMTYTLKYVFCISQIRLEVWSVGIIKFIIHLRSNLLNYLKIAH